MKIFSTHGNAMITDSQDLAVHCVGVTKSFGSGNTRTHVLRGVDFSARAGEMTFLMGQSGCGKTTLLSVLGGLLTPDAGQVSILGTDLTNLSGGRLVDYRLAMMGFLFQQYQLLTNLTALENAAVPLLARGVGRKEAYRKAVDLLDRLGIADLRSKIPARLSGGQQQRVAIARALALEPRLLFCDEPTAALDAESGRLVMQLIQEIAVQPHCAVIVVTHDDRIISFAQRVVKMSDGVILEDRDIASIPILGSRPEISR